MSVRANNKKKKKKIRKHTTQHRPNKKDLNFFLKMDQFVMFSSVGNLSVICFGKYH